MRVAKQAYLAGIIALTALGSATRAEAHEAWAAEWHLESGGRCTTCAGSPYFHWDFYFTPHHGAATHKGEVYQGTSNNTFNECMIVRVGGVDVNAASYTSHADNRGLDTQEYSTGNTRVIRSTHTPADGMDFTRWVDSFRNAGAAEANVTVQYYCYYYGCTGGYSYFFDGGLGGVDGAGDDCTVGSSDGDTNSEETDLWFAWNDDDASGKPAVAIITHGDGADEEPTSVLYGGWSNFTIDFRLTIPAGRA